MVMFIAKEWVLSADIPVPIPVGVFNLTCPRFARAEGTPGNDAPRQRDQALSAGFDEFFSCGFLIQLDVSQLSFSSKNGLGNHPGQLFGLLKAGVDNRFHFFRLNIVSVLGFGDQFVHTII